MRVNRLTEYPSLSVVFFFNDTPATEIYTRPYTLSLHDALPISRRFDAAVLRLGLSSPSPGVRRQAALAAGRIGDPEAVDLLIPVLNDSVPGVQAAAAFALGLLKDARAIPALQQTVRAVGVADVALPQLEAVTAIAKIGGEEGARDIGHANRAHGLLQGGN